MRDRMLRRDFISLLGGAAAAPFLWAQRLSAQQPGIPTIGFLGSAAEAQWTPYLAGFRRGLNESGFVESKTIAIEYRWANNRLESLPALATELVRRPVAVIVAAGGIVPAIAAKAATSTIPVVFVHGSDPVRDGLVASLNRPGGNVTGVSFLSASLSPKRIELLRELVPGAKTIAILLNPERADAEAIQREMREAASALGISPVFLSARAESEFDAAFASLVQQRADALLIGPDRLFSGARRKLAEAALRHAIPAIHDTEDYAPVGGLISYGPSIADAYRQAGVYCARILKGEKAADLPVMQPTKFELILNLKTAKALGLNVPPKLLALADAVIE
jgi:putative tryptophan/tyrosine transport system substrate-binding protein